MGWDIAVAVAGGILQFATAYLGWRVTMNPPAEKRKWLYELLFVSCGVLGILVIGLGTYRSISSNNVLVTDIQDLKKGQQTTNQGIQTIEASAPRVTVNMPPSPSIPQHTHVAYVSVADANIDLHNPPFAAVQKGTVTIPIAFFNSGKFAVKQPLDCWLLVLVPAARAKTGFRDTENQMKCSDNVGGSLPAGSGDGSYHTAVAVLTDDDVQKLKLGSLYLCGFGKVRWLDDSGKYETRFAQCLEAEPNQTLNWHNPKENNEEIKLH